MKKLNWEVVWSKFENWVADCESERDKCSVCGHVKRHFSSWDEQQKKIEQLVNKQLKKPE